ncbi:MAG: hypothetical protein K2O34_02275 [Acetatifactor sp.]|nr:hypothetical protein [Acetatifactor sp.]
MDSVLIERWFAMTLVQQMVNIGNEVKRAVRFDTSSDKKSMFLDRAIRYTELTMKDRKNQRVLPELTISKKVLEDYRGEHVLNCTKEQISNYYDVYVNCRRIN